jgi:hypothetical protein
LAASPQTPSVHAASDFPYARPDVVAGERCVAAAALQVGRTVYPLYKSGAVNGGPLT